MKNENENFVDAEVIDEETEMKFQGELNAKPEKKGFFTKVKDGIKTFPDKHPKLTRILIGAGGVAIGAVAAILVTKKDNSDSDSDNVELLGTSDDDEWPIDTDTEDSETFDQVETDEETED